MTIICEGSTVKNSLISYAEEAQGATVGHIGQSAETDMAKSAVAHRGSDVVMQRCCAIAPDIESSANWLTAGL